MRSYVNQTKRLARGVSQMNNRNIRKVFLECHFRVETNSVAKDVCRLRYNTGLFLVFPVEQVPNDVCSV